MHSATASLENVRTAHKLPVQKQSMSVYYCLLLAAGRRRTGSPNSKEGAYTLKRSDCIRTYVLYSTPRMSVYILCVKKYARYSCSSLLLRYLRTATLLSLIIYYIFYLNITLQTVRKTIFCLTICLTRALTREFEHEHVAEDLFSGYVWALMV
jgi:hypothetical protein